MAVLALLAATWGAACVDSGTEPSPSDVPSVAGNYSGTATLNYPELGTTMTCTATTSVTQSGATVNITPIVFSGAPCSGLTIPIGTVAITDTGNIPASVSGTLTKPDCGSYNYTVTGRFDGTEFRLSAVFTSTTCDDATLTLVLVRS